MSQALKRYELLKLIIYESILTEAKMFSTFLNIKSYSTTEWALFWANCYKLLFILLPLDATGVIKYY